MNNIKIMPGQVWECDVAGVKSEVTVSKVVRHSKNNSDVYFGVLGSMSQHDLYECGVFQQQTKLEYLAVEMDDWIYSGKLAYVTCIGDEIHWHPLHMSGHTKQQWQDKRIELGLDEMKESKGETEMKEDKEVIKIPVEWLTSKGLYLRSDDNWVYPDGLSCITEFAERENKGVQPVGDNIDVYCFGDDIDLSSRPANCWHWESNYLNTWKPNIEALHEMYLAEQEENKTKKGDVMKKVNAHNIDYRCDEYDRLDKFMLENGIGCIGENPVNCAIRELAEKHDIDVRTDEEKEDDKLKLTKDDIGKEFENEDGTVFVIKGFSDVNCSLLSDKGVYSLCQHNGVTGVDGGGLLTGLVKLHEPRWWLKCLPDADLFDDKIRWLYIEDSVSFRWSSSYEEPELMDCEYAHFRFKHEDLEGNKITCIKMPELKGGEWKQSKITIEELREFQQQNKK